ncbi:MAG: tetratricopeptide repeat protein [Bacteroidota bacterium]
MKKLIILLQLLLPVGFYYNAFAQIKPGDSPKKAVNVIKVFDKEGNLLAGSPAVVVSPDGNCIVSADVLTSRSIASAVLMTAKNTIFEVKNVLVSDPISNTVLLSLHNTDKLAFDYAATPTVNLKPGDEVRMIDSDEEASPAEHKRTIRKSSFVAGLGNLCMFENGRGQDKGGLPIFSKSSGLLGFTINTEDKEKGGFAGIQNLTKQIPYAISIPDWQKTGARDPLLGNAINSLADENYEEAIVLANQSLVLFPNSGPMNFVRGYARFNTKNYLGAISDLNAAADHGYTSQHLLAVRAHSKFLNQDYMGALSDFNRMSDSSMMDLTFRLRRGRCRFMASDFRGAATDLNAAINLGNTEAGTLYKLGVAYKELRDYPGAISALNRALAAGYKDASLYSSLGNCCFFQKDYRRAADNLQIAYNMGEQSSATLSNLGIAMYEIGNYSASVSYLNQAINKGAADKKLKSYRANAIASGGF